MFKNKLLTTLILSALGVPGLSLAADAPASPHTVTSNAGLTSNYVWRGISQTSGAPAIQGGMDYAHASGFYAGVWGSNVSWINDSGTVGTGSVTMELDSYLGYKSAITDDIGYDVGYIRYNYPGSGNLTAASGYALADTAEVYAALSYKFLTAKYSYSVLNQFLTVADEKGTNYLELNASYTIPDTSYTVSAHYGKQTYTSAAAASLYSYSDYKAAIAKDVNGYIVTLAYTSTDAKEAGYTYTNGGFWGKSATTVSLTHSF